MEFNKKWQVEAVPLRADATQSNVNSIPEGATLVDVQGVVTNANDFIVLPSLAKVPNGFCIRILANAASNFELRTPATSAEEINSEDCDGTKEALLTDTLVYEVVKINNTIGWMLRGWSAVGAAQGSVTPD